MEKMKLSSIYGKFGKCETDFIKEKTYGLRGGQMFFDDLIGEVTNTILVNDTMKSDYSEMNASEFHDMKLVTTPVCQYGVTNKNCREYAISDYNFVMSNNIPIMKFNPYETGCFPLLMFPRGTDHSILKTWFSRSLLFNVNMDKPFIDGSHITIDNIMNDWNWRQKYPRITTKVEVEVDGKLKYLSANLKTIHRGTFWRGK